MLKTESVRKLLTTEGCSKVKTEALQQHSGAASGVEPTVVLEDRDLWTRFQVLTNEMIVTKSGRRMFPVVKVSISGLDPSAMYSILLEFVQIDNHRWKYVNGEWVAGGKPEVAPASAVYIHCDSPNFGNHWMKEPVSFAKVKLTNKTNGNGQIMLNSLHKYEPRLHVVQVGAEQRTISCHAFPECQFIAVTAYQNEEVTALKIKHNPFAKAFLDSKERPDLQAQRDIMASYPQPHHQQYGWYMGGGVCGGGVAYGQTPPSMGLASTPASLSSRIAMRNHRVVPYTSPTPRAARTPPVNTVAQQQVGVGSYGLAGLAAEWRQQPWGHHHQPSVTGAPATPATPAHYQWAGLQGGYAHHHHHHGSGLYQSYQQPGVVGMGLTNAATGAVPAHPAQHAQRSPQEALTPMGVYSDTSVPQGYTDNRSSPTYDDSVHSVGANTGVYGSSRLHESPEHNSTGGGSPQSEGSPPLSHTSSHADMFILPDLGYPTGLAAAHSDLARIKGENLPDSLSVYSTTSPSAYSTTSPAAYSTTSPTAYSAAPLHAWSPLSPPACM
ncbi:T-box transcription factor T-like [Penaeus japonicus]|uniref:T-box transcription factor T-like n=1 Tax=Penaeus japonicus TaxID=27405 RepID=UPI001C70FD4E|nr:T-box transcription factor T-like [Penaeus japonicus]